MRSEYDRLINDKWRAAGMLPASPDATPDMKQAMRGARQIFRKGMKRPFKGSVKAAKRCNQRNWIEYGVLIVNPARSHLFFGKDDKRLYERAGWPDIVHDLSHYCHMMLRPNERPHSNHQLELEKELTNYVLSDAFKKYRK